MYHPKWMKGNPKYFIIRKMISVQYLGHSTCSKSPPIWQLSLFLTKTIIKWQYWMVHSGREVILQSQGFRNKVFVIEIPRELGRSSFNQSAMRQRHKTYIPQSGNPVCIRNIFDVSNPEKVVFIAMFRSVKILEICPSSLYMTWFFSPVSAQGLRRVKEYARLVYTLRHCSWK